MELGERAQGEAFPDGEKRVVGGEGFQEAEASCPPGPVTSHPTQALNVMLKLLPGGELTWKESGLY